MLWLKVIHSRPANKGVNPCIEVWVNYSLSSEKGPIRVELDPSERRSGPDWRIRGLSRLSDHPLSCARLALRDIRYAAASDKNLKDLRIPVQDPRQVTSLEEGDEYAHSNEKAVFLALLARVGPWAFRVGTGDFSRYLVRAFACMELRGLFACGVIGLGDPCSNLRDGYFHRLAFRSLPKMWLGFGPTTQCGSCGLARTVAAPRTARIDGGVAKSRAARG